MVRRPRFPILRGVPASEATFSDRLPKTHGGEKREDEKERGEDEKEKIKGVLTARAFSDLAERERECGREESFAPFGSIDPHIIHRPTDRREYNIY